MNRILFLFCFTLTSITIYSQDLNGKWNGELSQNDKSFNFTMIAEIKHEGEKIYGAALYVDPNSKSYAILNLTGSINNKNIVFSEHKVVENKINKGANYSGWCIKTFTGEIKINEADSLLIIEGSWYGDKAWSQRKQKAYKRKCSPGTFIISKKIKPKQKTSIPINKKMVLKNVLFEQSKSIILPESFTELNKLYAFLSENPKTKIRIEGHTDRIGNSKKNQILSNKRAKAIKEYLINKGIKSQRIETFGYGDSRIICPPKCKENRRVEFIITKN